MPIHKSVTLNTGAEMPTIGLGTWRSAPGDVGQAVAYALKEAGYRHIDTAYAYGNETEESGVPRNEIFLTTKLPNTHHGAVQEALDESLANLGTDYLDLWLMHWPAPMKDGKADKSLDWLDAWKEMEKIYETQRDKVKAIGISNFSVEFLERLLKEAKVVPAVNQIELHPQVPDNILSSCPQTEVVELCREKGIALTAYSPLGSENSPLLTDPTVTKIAEAHGVHPARILVSIWANTSDVAVLAKSTKPERIAENIKAVELAPEEIAELLKIEKRNKFRVCKPLWTGWGTLGFPDVKE